MLIGIFGKLLFIFTAIALIIYGLTPDATLGLLAKLLAVDIGFSLIIPLVYSYARGVRKGDPIMISEEKTKITGIISLFGFYNGRAAENGRIGKAIKVELLDGSMAVGKIVKYEGFLSNPEVKLLERTIPITAEEGIGV